MTLRRIPAALSIWPAAKAWRAAALELAWCVPLLGLAGWAGGFVHVAPLPLDGEWLRLFFLLMLVPALGQELLFRALLVPPPGKPFPLPLAALAIAAFVAWHPFQALTFGPPWSGLFLDPWFLTAVLVLGLALARIYRATGSVWPCTAAHWLIVAAWKLVFGGPG